MLQASCIARAQDCEQRDGCNSSSRRGRGTTQTPPPLPPAPPPTRDLDAVATRVPRAMTIHQGAKGIAVLHHFPIFRQFSHFHKNPSSSVMSGTLSRENRFSEKSPWITKTLIYACESRGPTSAKPSWLFSLPLFVDTMTILPAARERGSGPRALETGADADACVL